MKYFEDSRTVIVEDLYKVVNEEGDRIYSDNLLQKIQSGDFNCLNEINIEDRNNRYFMEPILFAVKNSEFGTYEVFKYYGEELQKQDLTIPTEIVINEPEVLEDTVITDNPTLVLHFAKINPDITLYISENLKSDGEFIEDLCETGNKEAISNVIRECNIAEVIQDNPELASNPEFMKEAIMENANLLEYASDDVKNNSEFMQEACKENLEVISYVVEHTKEFNKDILDGARGALEEHFITDANNDIEEETARIQEEEKEIPADENDSVKSKGIEKRKRDLASIMRAIKNFSELPEEKKPKTAHRYLVIVKNMPDKYRKMLEQYDQLYIAAQERERAEKENGNNGLEVTPEQIEEKANGARISGINGETREIREEYTRQTEEKEVTEYDRRTYE